MGYSNGKDDCQTVYSIGGKNVPTPPLARAPTPCATPPAPVAIDPKPDAKLPGPPESAAMPDANAPYPRAMARTPSAALPLPDCKNESVSLVWAISISRRNVVSGKYLPEDRVFIPNALDPDPPAKVFIPAVKLESPSAFVSRPSAAEEAPCAVVRSPEENEASPTALVNEPTEMDASPTAVVPAPSATDEAPCAATNAPAATESAPSAALPPPTANAASPETTNKRKCQSSCIGNGKQSSLIWETRKAPYLPLWFAHRGLYPRCPSRWPRPPSPRRRFQTLASSVPSHWTPRRWLRSRRRSSRCFARLLLSSSRTQRTPPRTPPRCLRKPASSLSWRSCSAPRRGRNRPAPRFRRQARRSCHPSRTPRTTRQKRFFRPAR